MTERTPVGRPRWRPSFDSCHAWLVQDLGDERYRPSAEPDRSTSSRAIDLGRRSIWRPSQFAV